MVDKSAIVASEGGIGAAALSFMYRFREKLKDAGIPSSVLEGVLSRIEHVAEHQARVGKRALREIALEVAERRGDLPPEVRPSGREARRARSRSRHEEPSEGERPEPAEGRAALSEDLQAVLRRGGLAVPAGQRGEGRTWAQRQALTNAAPGFASAAPAVATVGGRPPVFAVPPAPAPAGDAPGGGSCGGPPPQEAAPAPVRDASDREGPGGAPAREAPSAGWEVPEEPAPPARPATARPPPRPPSSRPATALSGSTRHLASTGRPASSGVGSASQFHAMFPNTPGSTIAAPHAAGAELKGGRSRSARAGSASTAHHEAWYSPVPVAERAGERMGGSGLEGEGPPVFTAALEPRGGGFPGGKLRPSSAALPSGRAQGKAGALGGLSVIGENSVVSKVAPAGGGAGEGYGMASSVRRPASARPQSGRRVLTK